MKDIIHFLIHPVDSVKTKGRQIAVAIEHSMPPTGSTIEEFPNLSISKASKLLNKSRKGGIQLEDWPIHTQEAMEKGQVLRPNGSHPEHFDV